MSDNNQQNKSSSSFLCNNLIDDNYNNLVQDKITKELIESKSCDSCDEKDSPDKDNLNEHKNIIIAKCNGLRGVNFVDNSHDIKLELDQDIIIKTNNEFEFATVIETGKMVSFRQDKIDKEKESLPVIDRIANKNDIERNHSNLENSKEAKNIFHDLIEQLSLEMKLVDVHFQFDRKKLFFFYTADGRVDFRELAKKLASHFKTRIELRQIGVRDEAKRIGGVATCGREYCCSSFLESFKRITTDIAIENNISTSISKYTGPCGKLKCCLSFEVS